jgi:hypothetical protein
MHGYPGIYSDRRDIMKNQDKMKKGMLNLSRLHSYDWGTLAASGTSVGGMTPGRVKRLERYKVHG